MRRTTPLLLLLFCLPCLAFAPGWSAERAPVIRKDKDYALFFAGQQYQDSRLTDLPNTVKNAREFEMGDSFGNGGRAGGAVAWRSG